MRGALTGGGDVIVQVGDAPVRTAEDLAQAIADQQVGATVRLTLVRDGSRRTVSVRLTDRPADDAGAPSGRRRGINLGSVRAVG